MIIKIKILLVGNMNDNHYQLFKYLKRQGVNADLIVFDSDTFKPKDADNEIFHEEHIKYVEWGNRYKDILTIPKKTLYNDLKGYDFYIVTGYGGIFLNKAGIDKKYIFTIYGTDIVSLSVEKMMMQRHGLQKLLLNPIAQIGRFLQIKAFKKSSGVCFFPRVFYQDLLKKNHLEDKRIQLGLYVDMKAKGCKLKEKHENILKKVRKNNNIVLFSPTRHFWSDCIESTTGIDILIRGTFKFIKKYPNCKIGIVFLEYGMPKKSKELIKKLGIEKYFYWLPKMKRGQVLNIYDYCDLTSDQFHIGSYGMAFMEAASKKKAAIIYLRKDYIEKMPPHFEAKTEEDICSTLEKIHKDKSICKKRGIGAYEFVRDMHGEQCGEKYLDLIKKHTNQDKKISKTRLRTKGELK